MKTETAESALRHHRWLRLIVEKTLPRGIRKGRLGALKERRARTPRLVMESVALVADGYRIQAVAAFNKYAFLAETGLIIVCFGGSSLPGALAVGLGAILIALTLRDAYTHDDKTSDASRYCLVSAGDAATAGLFLLVAETLALKISPSLAFPAPVLYHGALVCLPLISTLRMVLRSRPDPEAPFKGMRLSAKELYKRTWRLNILWMGAFNGLIWQNTSDVPGSWLDYLRGFLPTFTFLIWTLLQRDALGRRDKIETIRTDWKKKMSARMKETLPQGLQGREPFYWWYVALEVLIFVELAAALAEVVWPWFSGQAPDAGFLRPGICLVAFATIVSSWKYVKNSNRAAARALQAEIDAAVTP